RRARYARRRAADTRRRARDARRGTADTRGGSRHARGRAAGARGGSRHARGRAAHARRRAGRRGARTRERPRGRPVGAAGRRGAAHAVGIAPDRGPRAQGRRRAFHAALRHGRRLPALGDGALLARTEAHGSLVTGALGRANARGVVPLPGGRTSLPGRPAGLALAGGGAGAVARREAGGEIAVAVGGRAPGRGIAARAPLQVAPVPGFRARAVGVVRLPVRAPFQHAAAVPARPPEVAVALVVGRAADVIVHV